MKFYCLRICLATFTAVVLETMLVTGFPRAANLFGIAGRRHLVVAASTVVGGLECRARGRVVGPRFACCIRSRRACIRRRRIQAAAVIHYCIWVVIRRRWKCATC